MLGIFFLCVHFYAKQQVKILDTFIKELRQLEPKFITQNMDGITTKYTYIPQCEMLRPEEEFDTREIDQMLQKIPELQNDYK